MCRRGRPTGTATRGSSAGRAAVRIRDRVPVSEYLRLQRRFAHLFGEDGRPDIVARLQDLADHTIARYGITEEKR